MVSVYDGKDYVGLSTDTKPTDIGQNGATFLEMDTGKVFVFDAENSEWLKISGE